MGVTFKQTGQQIGLLIVSVDSLMSIERDGVPYSAKLCAIFTSENVPFWLFFCSFTLLAVKLRTGSNGCGQLAAGLMNLSVKLWITYKERDFLIN
jgi:hypothetical protein